MENKQKDRPQSANRGIFKDTLARALLADDAKKLRAMCEQLCDIALDKNATPGDRISAMKLIMERVDGRPAQQIEITGEDKPSSGLFKIVKIDGA